MLGKLGQATGNANFENIGILSRVRLIAIFGQILLIVFAIQYFDIHLPLRWLVGFIVVEIIFAIYSQHIINIHKTVYSIEVFFHLLFDSLILAGLVYFSGGANNPFIYLLLLFVALGSFMLSPRYLILITISQLVLYSILNLHQRPLELGESSPLASFHLHLAGMWVNFILTTILIAFFGLLTRRVMIKQEKEIQLMREKNLQSEQILSLGIMSANAAHELGTPLSTVATIIDDLEYQRSDDAFNQDLKLVASQIDICKEIISSLNKKSDNAKQQLVEMNQKISESPNQSLRSKIDSIIERWLVYRPQIKVETYIATELQQIYQFIPISVEQAFTNLLDNAADASLANGSSCIQIKAECQKDSIIIEILDNGVGISEDDISSLGIQIQETKKQQGLGWGMFLSNASIERAGGNIQIIRREEGGSVFKIKLPRKL